MKNPALLWYWNDWAGGTKTFSRHLKGCYMDLLDAQFNSGPLSLEEIKTVLGNDFAVWGMLSKKFKKTEEGLFFNERMESEKSKRERFSNSQKARVLKRWDKSGNDSGNTGVLPKIENDNDNDNENRNEKGVQGEKQKKVKKPKSDKTELGVIYPFDSIEFKTAWLLWIRYKSEQFNFRYKSSITEQSALKDLCDISGGIEETSIKLINYAISKGWKGIYKVQFEENGNKQRKSEPATSNEQLASVFAKHFASDSPK